MLTHRASRIGALVDCTELWPPDTGHHSGCAHCARTNSDFHDVGSGVDEISGSFRSDNIACHDCQIRDNSAYFFDRVKSAILMTMRCVDDKHVDAHGHERFGSRGRVTIDSHRDRNH
jgi:hypothetical protein